MTNIWSENKYIEILINIMLFLLGINFMHLGQFFLPLICLLLFIDRKFKFKVNDIRVFIILCLFAISFFIFSYKLGFYAVMGFTLPMAYYIGSNMNEVNQKNIKYVIYILALGMATYLVLNFFYELSFLDFSYLITKVRHEDVWTGQVIRPTLMGLYSYLLIAVLCYVLFEEKNKLIKMLFSILFIIIMIYNISLARRTVVLIVVLSLLLWFILANIKDRKSIIKATIFVSFTMILILSILLILIKFNIFGIWNFISRTSLYHKFIGYGFSSDRIEYLIEGIKLAPANLWGNRTISSQIGNLMHDLWSDIYDYAGIIPWALMIVYTLSSIVELIKNTKNKKQEYKFRIMILSIFLVFFVAFCLEPIMTSASIFMIVFVAIASCIESLNSRNTN